MKTNSRTKRFYKLPAIFLITFIILSFYTFSIALPTFTDVTEEAGVGDKGISYSVAFADYNDDGYLDIYISNGNTPATFYQNNGDGTFINIVKGAGLENLKIGKGTWAGVSGVWGDYDNDGDLDLYAVIDCFPIHPDAVLPCFNVLYRNNGDSTFTDVTEESGVQGDPGAGSAAIWGDYDNDNYLDLYVVNLGAANILYKNNGDSTFTDVTAVAGVEAGKDAQSSGVAAVFFDYDNDNDLDLYAVNAYGPRSFLYQKNGDGTFKDVAKKANVDDPGDPMCATVGDYDNDGYLDIYVVNYSFLPNALYRNQGDGTFKDVAREAGVDFKERGVSASFVDYDNDGYLDIYVVTKGSNVLYRNNGDGTFSDVTKEAGVISEQGGRSCAFGDYDNDGDLDLYIANSGLGGPKGEPNQLYRNDGSENNWLHIYLRSKHGHVDAIGARVEVIVGNLRQIAEVNGGFGILQNSLPLEFGLSNASKVDSVKVRWPDGTIRIVKNVQANQVLTIFEDTGSFSVETSYKLLISLGQIKMFASLTDDFVLRSVLYQNYPNPFNPETWIPYQLSKPGEVAIYIYSMTGKLMRVLNYGQKDTGYYLSKSRAAYWDGRNIDGESAASGIYFYRIKAGNFNARRKMILIK